MAKKYTICSSTLQACRWYFGTYDIAEYKTTFYNNVFEGRYKISNEGKYPYQTHGLHKIWYRSKKQAINTLMEILNIENKTFDIEFEYVTGNITVNNEGDFTLKFKIAGGKEYLITYYIITKE